MEFLRKYLTQIQAQLRGLTVSQKLLIGLLGAIIVGMIFWVVMASAKPQMVPLISQPLTAEQIAQIEMTLKGKYAYQVNGEQVLVPVEEAYAIRGMLAEQGALPKDMSSSFTSLAMNSITFETDANTARKWNFAVEQELKKWLCSFSYIESASVIIARGEQLSIGRQPTPSTATVWVKERNAEALSPSQVGSIADMVSGAVAGMKRENVHITDGQHSYHAPNGEMPMAGDMLVFTQQVEDRFAKKLYGILDYMGDVKIGVNVVLDLSSRRTEETSYDPKKTVSKPLEETSHVTATADGVGNGGEPGVTSNTAVVASDNGAGTGGGRRTSSNSTDSSTHSEVKIGSTTQTTITPPGVEISQLSASITVPRSFLVAMYRKANPTADAKADPTDGDLKVKIDETLKKTKDLAMNAIGAKAPEQVIVDWYDDTIAVRGSEVVAALAGTAGGSLGATVMQYGKQGVLAAVALGALGMMLMMVRRAVPSADGGDIDPSVFTGGGSRKGGGGGGGKGKRRGQGNVDQLDTGDDVFGEANEGDAVLTGIELDDETLQSRKMVDEVSTMIKENPENAAALVKRWMARSK